MKYFEVSCEIRPFSEDAADVLSAQLAEIGFESFSQTESGLLAYIQQSAWNEDEMRQVVRNFCLPEVEIRYTKAEAPDEDWNQVWEEEGFQPIIIPSEEGQEEALIVVHDVKHTDVPPAQYDIVITPRLAFGTGSHSTTRLILRTLARLDLKGKDVIDAGTGTGILANMAIKRGASYVFAYDIDEWSVENTRHNAQLNNVENIEVLQGDSRVLSHVSGVFDVIVANINRNILLQDMPHFCDVMNTSGSTLILSGFYEEDVPLLVEEASRHHLHLSNQHAENQWACLVFQRANK